MNGHNLVAVYRSRADAEQVRDRLIEFGIPAADIRLSLASVEPHMASERTSAPVHERHGSFWDWLFGNDLPEEDRGWYQTNLREGRTGLSVLVRNDAERERVADILEEFNPIEVDEGSADVAGATLATSRDMEAGGASAVSSNQIQAGQREITQGADQVIPVVKEELDVGKRAAERRYRIRTYVVERPVEQQVNLRDERVVVERRPPSGTTAGGANVAGEREFEVTERHEEPVVEKRARPVEEVVVRKEANERVETVRDTVRETKVDVDKEPAEGPIDRSGSQPPNRNP
jgi:stress response protein YsnF